jgi:hypothetical protein
MVLLYLCILIHFIKIVSMCKVFVEKLIVRNRHGTAIAGIASVQIACYSDKCISNSHSSTVIRIPTKMKCTVTLIFWFFKALIRLSRTESWIQLQRHAFRISILQLVQNYKSLCHTVLFSLLSHFSNLRSGVIILFSLNIEE